MSLKREKPVKSQVQQVSQRKQDLNKSIQVQKQLQLFYHQAKQKNLATQYKKIKYQGIIYSLNEFIQLHSINSIQHYIAKLKKIITISKQEDNNAIKCQMIQVEWCMKKKDISHQNIKKYMKEISASQVFPSNIILYVPVQAIVGKCEVLDFQEYSLLGFIQNSIYFTRSSYDIKTKLLTPSPQTWQKMCICQMPYNPDLQFIQCDECGKWFHRDCVFKNVKQNNQFACNACQNKNRKIKKVK